MNNRIYKLAMSLNNLISSLAGAARPARYQLVRVPVSKSNGIKNRYYSSTNK